MNIPDGSEYNSGLENDDLFTPNNILNRRLKHDLVRKLTNSIRVYKYNYKKRVARFKTVNIKYRAFVTKMNSY